MTAPVWIDTDMGADDLFAILAIARHAPLAGLSLTFGCTDLPQVAANAAGAARAFGWTCPITLGASRPILGHTETAGRVLGARGYHTRGAVLPDAPADFPPALPALADAVARGCRLLALGPLTNLATLALARPDLAWPEVVWMGGSLGPGNHTPAAEYNALADPEALAILLDRGIPLRMIDLEACRRVRIAEPDVTRLRQHGPTLLADLLGGYLDIALSRGRSAMALYDPVAAAALLRPDLFTLVDTRLAVTLMGSERGRTGPTSGPPNARTITDLDAPAIRTLCLAALEESCPTPT